ncbi:fumarylacetoacetate hydrolase family protein [Parasphingorhabdus cellanae]|uniref:Fumarylacetoacetate hydrolase family protein n=1 Tax=Parasphingorhabdus cellanae TaxID=2806553 RepID=A0ABX7T5T5_9SPHN|nr:fumarylacetoacetate hydrolase family protein [Parasphingorhabdus cellanae]QTD55829.1 fumarylacetoacetate hydrolase family protein [Parasphingorhabdus cellanae]
MKLGTIRVNGTPQVIAKVKDNSAVAVDYRWMEDLIEAENRGLDTAAKAIEDALSGRKPTIDLTGVNWMAPNPKASKILGCAVNNINLNKRAYKPMTAPMFFTKGRSALTGHMKTIELLEEHGQSINEPEPVAVFGKKAKNVSDENIMEHIFGWTLTNDVTASGVKFSQDSIALKQTADLIKPHHTGWRPRMGEDGEVDTYLLFIYHSKSKAADTFASMGPWITTKDEVPDPNNLRVRGYVDGECYTDDSTSNYYFPVERVLSEASKWFTMEPGDCVHTGTASKGTEKHPRGNIGTYMHNYDGKMTDVEIEGLGKLSNLIDSKFKG